MYGIEIIIICVREMAQCREEKVHAIEQYLIASCRLRGGRAAVTTPGEPGNIAAHGTFDCAPADLSFPWRAPRHPLCHAYVAKSRRAASRAGPVRRRPVARTYFTSPIICG